MSPNLLTNRIERLVATGPQHPVCPLSPLLRPPFPTPPGTPRPASDSPHFIPLPSVLLLPGAGEVPPSFPFSPSRSAADSSNALSPKAS